MRAAERAHLAPVATDAATFERWWKRRNLPNDRAIVHDAEVAGLIVNAGGLLSLTDAGKAMRREGERLRSVTVR